MLLLIIEKLGGGLTILIGFQPDPVSTEAGPEGTKSGPASGNNCAYCLFDTNLCGFRLANVDNRGRLYNNIAFGHLRLR